VGLILSRISGLMLTRSVSLLMESGYFSGHLYRGCARQIRTKTAGVCVKQGLHLSCTVFGTDADCKIAL